MKAISRPPFSFFDCGERGGYAHEVGTMASRGRCRWMAWVSVIGVIASPMRKSEAAMAGSLRRWGQLAPVVACVRGEKLELIDGFKRHAAAPQVRELTSLSVRMLEVDEPAAKAAILGLNRDQRPVRELEEAWVVQGAGARRRDDAGGGRAICGSAQELGVSAAGIVGEVECGGERRFAFGIGGSVAGAAVDAVARGQPGSTVGADASRRR